MQRLLHAGVLRPKLRVSQPGDAAEQEADRVADRIMRMPVTVGAGGASAGPPPAGMIQRACASCAAGGSACPQCRRPDDELIQRKAEVWPADLGSPELSELSSGLRDLGTGQPLDAATRAFFEPRFGRSFSEVRLHRDRRADEAARSVNALAFTTGRHIVFGAGHYAPDTAAGRRLLAHELTHVVQQASPGAHAEPVIQRACGRAAIGTPIGCTTQPPVFVPGALFQFIRRCDDFRPGEEGRLVAFAATLPATATVEIHAFASTEGDPTFNVNLSCARALKARSVLTTTAGMAASRITGVFNHGPTPGPADDRRSVVIQVAAPTPPPAMTRLSFRAASVSFLSCALCNPFTDDGTLGISPPATEPPVGSSFRQKHVIEAELGTFDGRTIAPGSARLAGFSRNVGVSGFCGATHAAHVVGAVGPGAPRVVTTPAGVQGIEFESLLLSRVGAIVPPTLPGSPCGFLGTNPLIPFIGNQFRMRLFADGTKESEFLFATLYPSHFLYEDGALKMFGGAPVHPRIDFFAWASSPIPLSIALVGLKALRFACCFPILSQFACDTNCVGGFSAPGFLFNPATCAAHGAALAVSACPAPCAPAGASCTPLVGGSNP